MRCDKNVYLCSPVCDDKTPCPDHTACSVIVGGSTRICAQCKAAPGPDMGSLQAACPCQSGFGNCNGDPSDGCEASLDTLTNCGTCGTPAKATCQADADHDGYGVSASAQLACVCHDGTVDATVSKGEDCDDADALVHPGQTSYFANANKAGTFDYDCDGVVTLRYNYAVDGTCGVDCSDVFWSKTAPACGMSGMAWNCNYPLNTGGCAIGTLYAVAQVCR
jgi:hypothetical protein